ncbi:MAG TPA: GatB/YqeY domain-containing protein [Phycisphaerae bacterium]|nr:GatB/YqeY domain-containing protein [Phycisphaerae bacterium]
MATENLKDMVQKQMVAAMKGGDKARTQVLRMVLSEIKRVEADKPDADPQGAVSGYAKTLRKTMGEMEKLQQPERVSQLRSELAIVEEFLPKQMDDAALAGLVEQTLAGMGPLTKKDAGRAMGAVMKAVAGAGASADAGKVRALVESRLQG